MWDGDDVKYRKITIQTIDKEKENTINAVLDKKWYVPYENKWIPCGKKLPKENEYYLVQNGYGDMLVAKYVKKDYWEDIYSRHKLGVLDDIVAWMSLPKPYNAEKE